MSDPVLRHQGAGLADRAVGCDADERRDRGPPGGERVEVEPRGGDEIEIGDDGPELRRLAVLLAVLEDEDRVHPVRRHHPRHHPERRLGRTADEAVAHRVADGGRLERDRKRLGAMLCVGHAWIVAAPGRNRIRMNYGTGDYKPPQARDIHIRGAWLRGGDYATAFSPTDAMPLTRPAKALM